MTTEGSFLMEAARALVEEYRRAERKGLYLEWRDVGNHFIPVTRTLKDAVIEVEAMIRDFDEVLAKARAKTSMGVDP